MNQKKLITFLIVVAILLAGATIYFATKKSAVNQVATLTDWRTYQNEKYGFELTFPDAWQGYNATSRVLNWGDLGASDSLDFGLPAQKEGLFNISIHAKNQWEELKKGEGQIPEYLGENETYVFGWTQSQAAVEGELEQRWEEAPSIIKTFKLVNKSANVQVEWKDFFWNGSAFGFKYPTKLCWDNSDCRDLYIIKIDERVSIGQIQKASSSNSEFIDSIFSIYYVDVVDQNDAEKYLKNKYQLSGVISWTADKNNEKVKIADLKSNKSYAAYSKELGGLVSFDLPLNSCLIDCGKIEQKILRSIKLDGVEVYQQ